MIAGTVGGIQQLGIIWWRIEAYGGESGSQAYGGESSSQAYGGELRHMVENPAVRQMVENPAVRHMVETDCVIPACCWLRLTVLSLLVAD